MLKVYSEVRKEADGLVGKDLDCVRDFLEASGYRVTSLRELSHNMYVHASKSCNDHVIDMQLIFVYGNVPVLKSCNVTIEKQ